MVLDIKNCLVWTDGLYNQLLLGIMRDTKYLAVSAAVGLKPGVRLGPTLDSGMVLCNQKRQYSPQIEHSQVNNLFAAYNR